MNSLLRPLGQRRPLLIFGILGTAGLAIGCVLGGTAITIYVQRHVLSLGHAVASTSLCIAGMVSWCSGLVMRTVRDVRAAVLRAKTRQEPPNTLAQAGQAADQSLALLLLGLPGTVVLLAGLALGARVIDIALRRHVFMPGYGIICTTLCIVGLMAGCTGMILHALNEILAELEAR